MRILQLNNRNEISKVMQDIKVDPYGIKIMSPKALTFLIRIDSLSNIAANILKQETLSIGADAAIARDALTGRAKTTGCLLMGNMSQFNRLSQKLSYQPFGLNKISLDLANSLSNYQKDSFNLGLSRHRLKINSGMPRIMGIINLTPDSFSGDGLYQPQAISHMPLEAIVDHAQKMISDGADIIDMGGESTRPQAKPVSLKEEIKRVVPAVKLLAKKIKAPLSIDTSKPQVAKIALDNGASIINDITGLKNTDMLKVIARYKAGVVIMHMKGNPRTMQKNPRYVSLIEEIIDFLDRSVNQALSYGILKSKIIIDPGIGFGKTTENNLEIIRRLKEFKVLGLPILVGTSRKSFIGNILQRIPSERIFGTIATCIIAAENGANILRVHDVAEVKQALKITERVNAIC
ncbi:MAG: dihydropteroate synthase [Candidatus Omnitrophica bacterium]|nr:dihydropteroate synthase [Candidatus Omnitrophota bacterium]